MAMVHPVDSAVGAKDERPFEDLVVRSTGNASMTLAAKPTVEISPNTAINNSDGDLSKFSSSNSMNRLEEFPNPEDNSKKTRSKKQKSSRFDRDNKSSMNLAEPQPSQPRRHRRRKSSGDIEKKSRKKVDVERLRKKMEEVRSVFIEADDSGHQNKDPNQNPNIIFEITDNPLERSPKATSTKIKHNSLSSYIANLHQGNRPGRRGSTNRSIDTSSTSKTKKKSNSSNQKKTSDGESKNSGSVERRARRTPRNSQMRNKMDGHYLNSPKNDGSTKSRLRGRRRNSGDVSYLSRSNSGERKPRRKYRHSISGKIDVDTRIPLPSTPKSDGASTTTPSKSKGDTFSNDEVGLVTPYNILQDPKYKSSARSYSDRVMIAAESNKSPMANLKKFLREERALSSSAPVNRVSRETRSLGRSPRMPKKMLQIPFSDGATNAEGNEKRDEAASATANNNSKATLQAFGKSVAKSMKKQAKNTKRKIGKQISKATKSATPTSDYFVEYKTTLDSPHFDDGGYDSPPASHGSHGSPLVALKPPSGLCPEDFDSDDSNSQLVSLKPPSGLCPEDYDSDDPISPLTALKPPSGLCPEDFDSDDLNSPVTALKPPSGLCPEDFDSDHSNSPVTALKPPSGLCPEDFDSDHSNSPVTALKPPSGIPPMEDGDDGYNSPSKPPSGKYPTEEGCGRLGISPRKNNNGERYSPMIALKPPSGHCPRAETGFQDVIAWSEMDTRQGNGKKSRKKTRSAGHHKTRQNRRSDSMKKIDEKLESVQANSDPDPSSRCSDQGSPSRNIDSQDYAIIRTISNQFPIFDDDDNDDANDDDNDNAEDSSIERSYKMNPALYEQTQALIDDGDSTIRDDEKVVSMANSWEQDFLSTSIQSKSIISTSMQSKSIISVSPASKPKTFSPSRLNARKQVSKLGDRSNSSSVSTLVTVPSLSSRTLSKTNTEKSSSSQNLNDDNENGPKVTTINEEDPKEQNKNTGEHIAAPKNKEVEENGANKVIKISPLPFQEREISTEEVETKNNKPTSQLSLVKEASTEKEDNGLSPSTEGSDNGITKSGKSKTKEALKLKTQEAADLSSELFDLLKNGKAKKEQRVKEKEQRAKERREATRERFEKHQREMRRLRKSQQHLIDMDITVDPDPLDVSEISNTLRGIEGRTSTKSRRNSASEGENATKDKKPKYRRRGSKKVRKKQDSAKRLTMAGAIEEIPDLSAEEKKD